MNTSHQSEKTMNTQTRQQRTFIHGVTSRQSKVVEVCGTASGGGSADREGRTDNAHD